MIGGHPGSEMGISSQLRDSVGFAPNFPRYLCRLLLDRTDALMSVSQPQRFSADSRGERWGIGRGQDNDQ